MQGKFIEAIDEGYRRAIIGDDGERRLKCATRCVPLPAPVAAESFRETIAQLTLCRRELTLAAHDLKHRLRPVLPQHGDAVDLTRLYGVGGCGEGCLRYQNAAAIFLVGTLQARR